MYWQDCTRLNHCLMGVREGELNAVAFLFPQLLLSFSNKTPFLSPSHRDL